MEYLQHFFQLFQYLLHIDTYLFNFVASYGSLTYVLLFAIIFCETGLVVVPFLPGDSLLFAAGSIAANPESNLNIQLLFLLLLLASILGNKTNFLIGKHLGPNIFKAKNSWLLNQKYLQEANAFYAKHGGKTIILARFIPIIRTFAPFVAGIGNMNMAKFSFYNIVSALLWIGSLLFAGYYFGGLPTVKEHFSLVVYAIVGISLLPILVSYLHKRCICN